MQRLRSWLLPFTNLSTSFPTQQHSQKLSVRLGVLQVRPPATCFEIGEAWPTSAGQSHAARRARWSPGSLSSQIALWPLQHPENLFGAPGHSFDAKAAWCKMDLGVLDSYCSLADVP